MNAIEQFKLEADQAERSGDYGKVAEIRYGKIKDAEKRLDEFKAKLDEAQNHSPMVKEEVTADDIADVVARWTGIPVTRMLQSEREKLLNLEEELHKRVVGQEEAIEKIEKIIVKAYMGLTGLHKSSSRSMPKGILFFVIGGFLVGFGTRYAGGCTSGHSIMGISALQWPSLVATIFFMLGGFFMTHVLLAPLMKLVGF